MALAFLGMPLAAILLDGAPGLTRMPSQVWRAAGLSLGMALASALLSAAAALVLALGVAGRARGARGIEVAAMLPLAASGLVVGTGLFVVLRRLVAPEDVAIPVTILINAAMALPFGFRLLLPDARRTEADFGRLAAALGLSGRSRLRWLDLPRAMGDLGVIALFAGEHSATLPLVIQRLMGAYRMEQAAAASVLLVGLSFGVYALFDLWGRRYAAA